MWANVLRAFQVEKALAPAPNPDKYADELLDAHVFVGNADALFAEYCTPGVEFT
jgi:hypothetical protein